MRNFQYWKDVTDTMINILAYGQSNFWHDMALHEVVNVFFMEMYKNRLLIRELYREYCNDTDTDTDADTNTDTDTDTDSDTNSDTASDATESAESAINLYNKIYGGSVTSIANLMRKTYNITFDTKLTVHYKDDLMALIKYAYRAFGKKRVTCDEWKIIYTYIAKRHEHYKTRIPSPIMFATNNAALTTMISEIDILPTEKWLLYDTHTSNTITIYNTIINSHKKSNNNKIATKTYQNIKRNANSLTINTLEHTLDILALLIQNFSPINIKNVNCDKIISNELHYDVIIANTDYYDRDPNYTCPANHNRNNYRNPNTDYNDVQLEIPTTKLYGIQLQMILRSMNLGGRCAITLPQTFLYNNGTSKNNDNFINTITHTWEYKMRAHLIDQYNIYKIVILPISCHGGHSAILYIENAIIDDVEKHSIKFHILTDTTTDTITTRIVTVPVKSIMENNYCLLPYIYENGDDADIITDTTSITKTDFYNSKISFCQINNEVQDRLLYRSILFQIYEIIGDPKKIKKHTKLNMMVNSKYNECGYSYIEPINISLQGADAPTTLEEIITQCKIHKITLTMDITLNDNTKKRITA